MKIMTQLAFDGTCRQAFEHYERIFNGKIVVMNTFGGSQNTRLPPGSSPAAGEKVRFAELHVGDQAILGNDLPEGQFKVMQGFNVAIHIKSEVEARRIFAELAEGGTFTTSLAKVDWADLFGMVTDRFGVPWLVLALPG